MSGFFEVIDVPERRVVQYKRVSSSGSNVVYIADESILGAALDEMPYADKTGLAIVSGFSGTNYELPYLPDAGAVYISTQPLDSVVGDTLTAEAKAGKAPYSVKWYKDGMQVVNIPDSTFSLKVLEAGEYFMVVTDADGAQAFSKAVAVSKEGVE